MNRQDLINEVKTVYSAASRTAYEYRETAVKCATLESVIKTERARLFNSGVITGKNAETREAEIQTLLVDEYEELMKAEFTRDQAYALKELAEINLARVRTILRVYELSDEVFGDEE